MSVLIESMKTLRSVESFIPLIVHIAKRDYRNAITCKDDEDDLVAHALAALVKCHKRIQEYPKHNPNKTVVRNVKYELKHYVSTLWQTRRREVSHEFIDRFYKKSEDTIPCSKGILIEKLRNRITSPRDLRVFEKMLEGITDVSLIAKELNFKKWVVSNAIWRMRVYAIQIMKESTLNGIGRSEMWD